MIRICNVPEAKNSILKRQSIFETKISQNLKDSIRNIFGEYLEPIDVVRRILTDVKLREDKAIYEWTFKIDKYQYRKDLELQSTDLDLALEKIDKKIVKSINVAIDRLFTFHKNQPITDWTIKDSGDILGQIIRPIDNIGVYIPGGTAPLPSTVIHTIIPAIVAGVKKIIVVSPPKIAEIIKATLALIKTRFSNIQVFQVGGVQAIGALTFGSESIQKVDKIVGPGNLFVTLAKREVFGLVGIDGLAGPTEAVIISDESGTAKLIASDLLAQAEHDFLAIPILITTSETLAKDVQQEIEIQIRKLSREKIAEAAIINQGGIVLVENIEEGFQLVNDFAPEHLSIVTKNSYQDVNLVRNSGGIFIGEDSCEVLGDYVAGPSHVMPTGGSALFNSSLNVLDFVKVIPVTALSRETVQSISEDAEVLAQSEGLTAHAEAARRRSYG